MYRIVWLFISLLIGLAGCAINDVAPESADGQPATGINTLSGCDNLSELETWLQTITLSHQAFQERLNALEGKEIIQFGDDLLYLITVRETLNNLPIPECMAEVKTTIYEAWSQAIDAYTAYASGGSPDITPILDTSKTQMSQTGELISQLQAQLQARINQSS